MFAIEQISFFYYFTDFDSHYHLVVNSMSLIKMSGVELYTVSSQRIRIKFQSDLMLCDQSVLDTGAGNTHVIIFQGKSEHECRMAKDVRRQSC